MRLNWAEDPVDRGDLRVWAHGSVIDMVQVRSLSLGVLDIVLVFAHFEIQENMVQVRVRWKETESGGVAMGVY